MSTPLFQDEGHFYAVENDGRLCCLDAASAKEVWTTREPTSGNFGNLHLTPNGDRVFLFNHKGHLILARLTPKGYGTCQRNANAPSSRDIRAASTPWRFLTTVRRWPLAAGTKP
jgi:outer membrane protein assembly factor BamB